MDIILIPGLWLDESSWDRVVPLLREAGHRVVAVNPPGHDGQDPSTVTYGDLVATVVNEIDHAHGRCLVVGHSAHCAAAWAAADRRVDQVAGIVLIGGFPIPDGSEILDGFEPSDGVLPFVGWDAFDGPDTADLDQQALAELEGAMSPAPAAYAVGPQHLQDERRYDLPVTLVCPEYTQQDLQAWAQSGAPHLSELSRLRRGRYVDLHSGHWPQWSMPRKLADVILDCTD